MENEKKHWDEYKQTSKLMDATKSVLRGKFRVINAYIKKEINNLTFHLKLEKAELNPKQAELRT